MAAKTLLQLRMATRALVGDSTRIDPTDGVTVLQGPTTWSDVEINSALNFAQNDYCFKKRCTLTTAIISSGSRAPVSSFGEDTIVHAEYAGVAMDASNLIFEDRLNPGWRVGSSGTPKRWLVQEGVFYLSPNASGATATVLYLDVPSPMTADGDTPDTSITEAHHDALAYLAAAQLLLQGRDQAAAGKAGSLGSIYLNLIGVSAGQGA